MTADELAAIMKQCSKCHAEKPLTAFNRRKTAPDGHTGVCKECRNAYLRKRFRDNPERERERMRAWREAHPNYSSERNKRFAEKYPEKVRSRRLLQGAVRYGRIKKPQFCERCGLEPPEPLHGHHHDYEKPYDVEWLCQPCHEIADKELRA